jgi:hypothetical protein
MKRIVLLSVVASLALLVIGTSASAQTMIPRDLVATIACRGNTSACVKLDLYQKMASTGGTAAAAQGQSQSGAARSDNNPVTARRSRAAGGVENNPVDNGGGAAIAKVRYNSDQQRKLLAQSARRQAVANVPASQGARPAQADRVRNRMVRRGDDPTINNPDSTGHAAVQSRAQTSERAVSRSRLNVVENRMQSNLRAREITRHRPSDF